MDALTAWQRLDHGRAILPADRAAIEATAPVRELVLELLRTRPAARDLYNACARLGRMLGDAGASPSLAGGTIDSAVAAIGGVEADVASAARASLLEGFAAAVRDEERAEARARWEAPVVTIDAETVAIVAMPDADVEWAGRLASRLARSGTKRAYVAGDERGRAEVVAALEIVGIAVATPGAGVLARARRLFARR